MALVMICSASVFAASYNFIISPPYAGCVKFSNKIEVTGSTPYVNPSVAATPTTYVIVPGKASANYATNILTGISTAGRINFKYNHGYGGSGQRYYLAAHSTETEFLQYKVTGTWNP